MDEEAITATIASVEALDPAVGAAVADLVDGLVEQIADLEDALEAAGGDAPAEEPIVEGEDV